MRSSWRLPQGRTGAKGFTCPRGVLVQMLVFPWGVYPEIPAKASRVVSSAFFHHDVEKVFHRGKTAFSTGGPESNY